MYNKTTITKLDKIEIKTTLLSSYTGKTKNLSEEERKQLKPGFLICRLCRMMKPSDEFYPIGDTCRTSYCRICCKKKDSIDRLLKAEGKKTRNCSMMKLPKEVQNSIMDDIALGKTLADISRKYKIPYQNIMVWKKKGKLVRPPESDSESEVEDYYEEVSVSKSLNRASKSCV